MSILTNKMPNLTENAKVLILSKLEEAWSIRRVFMVALQAWLAQLGNRSTNGSTAFKKRRGVARTLLE
jgi:hypothetical protein